MAFPPEMLQDGEELILDLRPHWWPMVTPGAVLAGAVVVGLAALRVDVAALQVLVLLGVFAALGWFGVCYARWVSTGFTVTSERIIHREGLLSRKATQMPLEKINTVDFRQSFFERIIGAGDLIIESGSERGSATFGDIRKPLAVQQEITRQMDLHDRAAWRVPQATPAPPSPAPASIPDQIAQLARLRDEGVLTEEEFAAKKTELLGRM